MKLAGQELMFGKGCLEYIESIKTNKVSIVIGGSSMVKSGMLEKVKGLFAKSGAEIMVVEGVEPDPSLKTVQRGAKEMEAFHPDLIVALGGGSAMDAAKTMWVFYEHPELTSLEELLVPEKFPKLRKKARFCCIPSTSGTASEVSRSVVITDTETDLKVGIGNMEMMPDIAICDPEVTATMPPKITAETGMDALTHALEALVSTRANYVSDVLATQAIEDIIAYLPKAYEDGEDLEAREKMLNASMIAGMAFTNVSLGIVHSMAHTLGSYFHIPHGLANAILLPYVMRFNAQDEKAASIYEKVAKRANVQEMQTVVWELNKKLGIPLTFSELIEDKEKYDSLLETMATLAKNDGCTKTNPIIPSIEQFKKLFEEVYKGE